jgi:hypothetical protein
LLAVVGLSVWVAGLHRRLDQLSGPRTGVFVADLLPEEVDQRRGAGEEVRAPRWADRLLLLLNLADPRTYPSYRAEVTGPEGERVVVLPDLHRSPSGLLALEIPRQLLTPGRYRILLYGEAPQGPEEVAGYTFDFAAE